jgi:hypothetical protein
MNNKETEHTRLHSKLKYPNTMTVLKHVTEYLLNFKYNH